MAYTEFCCRAGGHNLNAGSLDGVAEPATAPVLTVTGCDYNGAGAGVTMPVGTSMTEFVTGRYVSVCKDGDTAPTANQFVVGRVQSVNVGTRTVTFAYWQPLGALPAASSGWTVRVGGAWAGPSGASAFPINFVTVGIAGLAPRVNHKNDQVYSVTANMATVGDRVAHRGYTAAFGDGGRTVIDGGTTGAGYTVLSVANSNTVWDDFTFQNNGGTGGSGTPMVSYGGTENIVTRCSFGPCRGPACQVNGGFNTLVECEAFGFNQVANNSLNVGFWSNTSAGNLGFFVRCVAHDPANQSTNPAPSGSSGAGWYISGGTHVLIDCIGFNCSYGMNSGSVGQVNIINCDFYNNKYDGINFQPNGSFATHYVTNCNLFKNGGYGINASAAGSSPTIVQTAAFGSGTQANTSGAYVAGATVNMQVYDLITFPADAHPWVAPDVGDFRISHAAAIGRGRGAFLQTTPGLGGTVSYPDLGAGQHYEPTEAEVAAAVWSYANRTLTG